MGPVWSVAAPGGGACRTEGADNGGGDGDDESHGRSLNSGDEDRVQGAGLNEHPHECGTARFGVLRGPP